MDRSGNIIPPENNPTPEEVARLEGARMALEEARVAERVTKLEEAHSGVFPQERPRLHFSYVNWRGEDHTYEVHPTALLYTRVQVKEDTRPEMHWCLNAQVYKRDGHPRLSIRTFILEKMTNIKEVPS